MHTTISLLFDASMSPVMINLVPLTKLSAVSGMLLRYDIHEVYLNHINFHRVSKLPLILNKQATFLITIHIKGFHIPATYM